MNILCRGARIVGDEWDVLGGVSEFDHLRNGRRRNRITELAGQFDEQAPEGMLRMYDGGCGDGEDADDFVGILAADRNGERGLRLEPCDPGGRAVEAAVGGIASADGGLSGDGRFDNAEAQLIKSDSSRGLAKAVIDLLVHVGYRAEAEQFKMLVVQSPASRRTGVRLDDQFLQRAIE